MHSSSLKHKPLERRYLYDRHEKNRGMVCIPPIVLVVDQDGQPTSPGTDPLVRVRVREKPWRERGAPPGIRRPCRSCLLRRGTEPNPGPHWHEPGPNPVLVWPDKLGTNRTDPDLVSVQGKEAEAGWQVATRQPQKLAPPSIQRALRDSTPRSAFSFL